MALVPLRYCPATSSYCSCVALRHPLKKVVLPCPSRTELETGKTGFVICCQICFYGSKFFRIGLLTTNASLSRASCKSFCSGFVPCVNPASLSPSLKVLYCIPLYFWGLGEFHKWCAYGIDFPVLFQCVGFCSLLYGSRADLPSGSMQDTGGDSRLPVELCTIIPPHKTCNRRAAGLQWFQEVILHSSSLDNFFFPSSYTPSSMLWH